MAIDVTHMTIELALQRQGTPGMEQIIISYGGKILGRVAIIDEHSIPERLRQAAEIIEEFPDSDFLLYSVAGQPNDICAIADRIARSICDS